jgi:hypothetical protein
MDDAATKSAISAAIDEIDPHAGDVDITQLWFTLAMSPVERLEYHDQMRLSVLELRRAGRNYYGITGHDDLDPESSAPDVG